jgi:hypothetical protein
MFLYDRLRWVIVAVAVQHGLHTLEHEVLIRLRTLWGTQQSFRDDRDGAAFCLTHYEPRNESWTLCVGSSHLLVWVRQ